MPKNIRCYFTNPSSLYPSFHNTCALAIPTSGGWGVYLNGQSCASYTLFLPQPFPAASSDSNSVWRRVIPLDVLKSEEAFGWSSLCKYEHCIVASSPGHSQILSHRYWVYIGLTEHIMLQVRALIIGSMVHWLFMHNCYAKSPTVLDAFRPTYLGRCGLLIVGVLHTQLLHCIYVQVLPQAGAKGRGKSGADCAHPLRLLWLCGKVKQLYLRINSTWLLYDHVINGMMSTWWYQTHTHAHTHIYSYTHT